LKSKIYCAKLKLVVRHFTDTNNCIANLWVYAPDLPDSRKVVFKGGFADARQLNREVRVYRLRLEKP